MLRSLTSTLVCSRQYLVHLHRRRIVTSAICKNESFRIYTRSGDGGTSSTFTGERRPKDDIIFEALGTIDELSAAIGVARLFLTQSSSGSNRTISTVELLRVQCILQEVASIVATPSTSARPAHLTRTGSSVSAALVAELESLIDTHSTALPPLKNFILQGGGAAGSHLHLARAVCRRAERTLQPLVRAGHLHASAAIYLNRLSDYLFTLARVAAQNDGFADDIYRSSGTKTADQQANGESSTSHSGQ